MREAAGKAWKVVCRRVRRRTVRGVLVVLLGGVTMVLAVRAFEGGDTRDPVQQLRAASQSTGPAESYAQVEPVGPAGQKGSRGEKDARTAAFVEQFGEPRAEYERVDAGYLKLEQTQRLLALLQDGAPGGEAYAAFYDSLRRWGRVALPGYVTEVFGDFAVYVAAGAGDGRLLVGMRGDTVYDLPDQLNQLLVDGGLEWTPKNAGRLTRAYAAIMLASANLCLDWAFMSGSDEEFFRWKLAPGVDSVLSGLRPLIPDFELRDLHIEVGGNGRYVDWSRVPDGAVAEVNADVVRDDWTSHLTVYMIGGEENDKRSFPDEWHGIFGSSLMWPALPEPEGKDGSIYFKVDPENSDFWTVLDAAPPYGREDSVAYTTVCFNGSPTNPKVEFDVRSVPDNRSSAFVEVVPLHPSRQNGGIRGQRNPGYWGHNTISIIRSVSRPGLNRYLSEFLG